MLLIKKNTHAALVSRMKASLVKETFAPNTFFSTRTKKVQTDSGNRLLFSEGWFQTRVCAWVKILLFIKVIFYKSNKKKSLRWVIKMNCGTVHLFRRTHYSFFEWLVFLFILMSLSLVIFGQSERGLLSRGRLPIFGKNDVTRKAPESKLETECARDSVDRRFRSVAGLETRRLFRSARERRRHRIAQSSEWSPHY